MMPFPGRPPLIPSQETIDKWEKGAANPETLAFEDRQKLLRRHPYGASNAYCNKYTGMDLDALVKKAAHTDDLTYLESSLVLYGTASWMDGWRRQGDGGCNSLAFAIQAQKNAHFAQLRHSESLNRLWVTISTDDRKNIAWADQSPWVIDLENRLEDQPEASWGFVCIRTSFQDNAAWEHFQEQFNAAVDISLSLVSNSKDAAWTPDRLGQRWKTQWVEYPSLENATLDDLCPYFRQFRDERKIEPGLRQDAFLYANAAAIQSSLDRYPMPVRGFVVAADSSHDASKLPTYLYKFKGNVPIALMGVFTSFYARLIPRGDPDDDPTVRRGMRQSWDVIFYKSRYNRTDGSYPPASQLNRN